MFKKKSVFFQYYLSYISVILLGCASIGIVIFFFSVSELQKSAINAELNQLQLVCKDFDTQMEVFKSINDSVSTNVVYRPVYYSQESYREIELLKDFKQYQTYSVFCKDYCLYYFDNNSVFDKEAKYDFDHYFKHVVCIETEKHSVYQLQNSLNNLSAPAMLDLDKDTLMLVYPSRLGIVSQNQYTAALCFILKREEWINRTTEVAGSLNGRISIYYCGKRLAGEELPLNSHNFTTSDYDKDKNILAAKSPSGDFIVTAQIPAGGIYQGLHTFRFVIVLILVVSVFVVMVLVFWIADKNYAPIRKLAFRVEELLPDRILGDSSELKRIEHAILKTHEQNTLNQKQLLQQSTLLKQQSTQLRQQLLLLVLNGSIGDNALLELNHLGVCFDSPYYCVFLLHFHQVFHPSVLASVEGLSDEDFTLYAFPTSEHQACVIGCLSLAESLHIAVELMQELSSAMENAYDVKCGMVIDSIDKMTASYYTAQLDSQTVTQSPTVHADNSAWSGSIYLHRLFHAIRDNNRKAAQSSLDDLMDSLCRDYPSLLLQRSVLSEILSELVRLSYELNVPISSKETGAILFYHHHETVRKDLKALLNNLFDRLEEKKASQEKDLSTQILQYIQQHALQYDTSIQKVADHFQISPKQVNSYLRSAVNQTYKEYEISIRLQHAKKMLTSESYSVVQISERIGYTDVSSFIKAFKSGTGMTPATFRKMHTVSDVQI